MKELATENTSLRAMLVKKEKEFALVASVGGLSPRESSSPAAALDEGYQRCASPDRPAEALGGITALLLKGLIHRAQIQRGSLDFELRSPHHRWPPMATDGSASGGSGHASVVSASFWLRVDAMSSFWLRVDAIVHGLRTRLELTAIASPLPAAAAQPCRRSSVLS